MKKTNKSKLTVLWKKRTSNMSSGNKEFNIRQEREIDYNRNLSIMHINTGKKGNIRFLMQ